MILQRDIRTPPLQSERRLQGHRQEVCGLKWSTDHQLLASGGNDNKVGAPGPPPSRPRAVPSVTGQGRCGCCPGWGGCEELGGSHSRCPRSCWSGTTQA